MNEAQGSGSRLKIEARATLPNGKMHFWSSNQARLLWDCAVRIRPDYLPDKDLKHGPFPQEGTKTLKISSLIPGLETSRTFRQVNHPNRQASNEPISHGSY